MARKLADFGLTRHPTSDRLQSGAEQGADGGAGAGREDQPVPLHPLLRVVGGNPRTRRRAREPSVRRGADRGVDAREGRAPCPRRSKRDSLCPMRTPAAAATFALPVAVLCGLLWPARVASASPSPCRATWAKGVVTAYGANGDVVTDDTAAIQAGPVRRARGSDGLLRAAQAPRLPAGANVPHLRPARGDRQLRPVAGARGGDVTTLLLADHAAAFASAAAPAPMIRTDSVGFSNGNTAFHDRVADLTIDAGHGNPGAIGLDFIVSNSGAVRNVVIRSGDGGGATVGLDMTAAMAGTPASSTTSRSTGFRSAFAWARPSTA